MAEWLPESNAPSDVEQISDEIRQIMSKNEVLNKIQTGELMLVDKSKDSRSRNRELWSKCAKLQVCQPIRRRLPAFSMLKACVKTYKKLWHRDIYLQP